MRRRLGRRATVAGLATTAALVAAVVALGALGSGYVAFDRWPGTEPRDPEALEVGSSFADATSRAVRRLRGAAVSSGLPDLSSRRASRDSSATPAVRPGDGDRSTRSDGPRRPGTGDTGEGGRDEPRDGPGEASPPVVDVEGGAVGDVTGDRAPLAAAVGMGAAALAHGVQGLGADAADATRPASPTVATAIARTSESAAAVARGAADGLLGAFRDDPAGAPLP